MANKVRWQKQIRALMKNIISPYVTGFGKTDPNRTFGISRITNLKYLIHSESLLLGCSRAILAV